MVTHALIACMSTVTGLPSVQSSPSASSVYRAAGRCRMSGQTSRSEGAVVYVLPAREGSGFDERVESHATIAAAARCRHRHSLAARCTSSSVRPVAGRLRTSATATAWRRCCVCMMPISNAIQVPVRILSIGSIWCVFEFMTPRNSDMTQWFLRVAKPQKQATLPK